MVGRPADAGAGFFIFDQTPRHQIAESSHPVLLDVISRQVLQCEIHEPSDRHVGRFGDFTLPAVDAELPGHGSVEPTIGIPRVGAAQRTPEIRCTECFGQCNKYGHIFGATTGHDPARRHMYGERLPVRNRQSHHGSIVCETSVFQKCVDALHRRRYNRQPVAPVHFIEITVYLVERTAENRLSRICRCNLVGLYPLDLRKRLCKCFLDLGPQYLAGIVKQFFFGMGCESSRVQSDAGYLYAVVDGRNRYLIRKSRSGNRYRGNAYVFCGYARPRLLGGTQPAAAVAAYHGIHAQLFQFVLKCFCRLAPDAGTGGHACRADFAQHIDRSCRILFQYQPLSSGCVTEAIKLPPTMAMVLPSRVESRESRSLFDRTDEGLSQRADNREYLARRHRAPVGFDDTNVVGANRLLC